MSNSIDQNLTEGSNTIQPSLVFTWVAIFKDSTKIEQFENGIEHKYKEINNRLNELVYFSLTDKQGHMFTVDLYNGLIGFNYLALSYIKLKEKKENIRLIFFRQHKIEIGSQDLLEKKHDIEYHLGYQYLDKNGYNQKIILKIEEEGSFLIGD